MSEIDLSTARYSLQSVSAGMDGVLTLLEQQSKQFEGCFSAFCLLGLVKAQLEKQKIVLRAAKSGWASKVESQGSDEGIAA